MSTAMMQLLALTVAGLCVLGVVVDVVLTGRDGRLTDLLAVVAIAAFVLAWRLHSRLQRETVAD